MQIHRHARRRKPTHPGEFLRRELLARPAGGTSALAASLGISATRLRAVLAGRLPLTVSMAQGLADHFGGSPEGWLAMQSACDRWLNHKRAAGRRRK